MRSWLVLCFLVLMPLSAHADARPDETRAQSLFREVRCVACQGQDIADSDAAIAADMRAEIRREIAAGRSNAEIRKGLYEHYGDYVLFRPRLSAGNMVLWGLPPLIVIIGIMTFVIMGRRRALTADPAGNAALTADEQSRLKALLDKDLGKN